MFYLHHHYIETGGKHLTLMEKAKVGFIFASTLKTSKGNMILTK